MVNDHLSNWRSYGYKYPEIPSDRKDLAWSFDHIWTHAMTSKTTDNYICSIFSIAAIVGYKNRPKHERTIL